MKDLDKKKLVYSLILLLAFGAVAVGQLFRFRLVGSVFLSAADVAVLIISLTSIIFFVGNRSLKKFAVSVWVSNWRLAIIFLSWALIALLLNIRDYSTKEVAVSFGYWVRLLAVFFTGIVAWFFAPCGKSFLRKSFFVLSTALVVVGFAELIVFPDFGFMTQYGWDPHIGRMLSTFFDPNYFGAFLVLVMAFSAALIQNKESLKPTRHLYFSLLLISWVALYLTFSRSAWMMGAIALPISFWPHWKKMILVIAVFISAIFLPGRMGDRFAQGSAVVTSAASGDEASAQSTDPSAYARKQSIERAWRLGKKNWLYGVGFNAYGPAMSKQNSNNSNSNDNSNLVSNHSSQGSDSSIINVFVTTGIIGLIIFLAFWFGIAKSMLRSYLADKNQLGLSLFAFIMAWFAGSIFNNTLFYLLILLPFLILVSPELANKHTPADEKQKYLI